MRFDPSEDRKRVKAIKIGPYYNRNVRYIIGKADVVGVAKRATLFWKIWHQNGAGRISYRAIGAARRAKEKGLVNATRQNFPI